MLKFKTVELEEFTVVHFEIDGVLEPKELKSLNPPKVKANKGVVLSGRGPIWLYAFLVHYYHPVAWVGTYDPRIGVVVVESHVPEVKPGDVYQLNIEEVL